MGLGGVAGVAGIPLRPLAGDREGLLMECIMYVQGTLLSVQRFVRLDIRGEADASTKKPTHQSSSYPMAEHTS